MTRADAALRLAQRLGIAHNDSPEQLHGLFPGVFPGGYEGVRDLAYVDRPATLEHVIVALVRWAGWDTVHYDSALEPVVAPHVSPEVLSSEVTREVKGRSTRRCAPTAASQRRKCSGA